MPLADLPPLGIGSHAIDTPVILAPMAGVSESPFRIIALELGAGLAPTELVSAKGLKYANARTEGYLRYDPTRERPFAVQIFGGEPDAMGLAAEMVVERGAQIVDINMGCPVKKVTRTGAGSALMCDPERTTAIVQQIRERVGDDVPVTAKIRAGWDAESVNAPEFGRRLEDAGVAAIAVHGRTRQQGYAGHSDWSVIRSLVKAVSVPVIANGDIFSADDADRVVDETGCAGVMIGRGALGNPWCFAGFAARRRGQPAPEPPTATDRAAIIRRHFDEHLEHVGDAVRGVRKFRQHLIWYSRGYRGGAAFREAAMKLEAVEAVRDAIEAFFGQVAPSNPGEAAVYDSRRALG